MAAGVSVLRYGHRDVRDYRVTSHCCLAARALGAEEIIIEGSAPEAAQTIEEVSGRWGRGFEVKFTKSWHDTLRKYSKDGYKTVHLTMYGLPLMGVADELRKLKKVLVIIGSQKVERAVYEESDYNVAIGDQPHSEISALAVFLHEFFRGAELDRKFEGAKLRIVPQKHGKKIAEA